MSEFIMFGNYSADAINAVSAERTEKGKEIIENNGGTVKSIHALLGETDLVIVADFPGNEEAMKASVALTRYTGISFVTCPAVSAERFDEIVSSG
jgi:uncharacterized protein with GYD domain